MIYTLEDGKPKRPDRLHTADAGGGAPHGRDEVVQLQRRVAELETQLARLAPRTAG